MPQNTPMKRQFITIDGRTVMSNLPQHWGGNDWKITGVDNPLPVGNYVQTDTGVWIPQKGSDDGAADVRLTGSIVVLASGFNDITISAGSSINLLSGINLIEQGFTKIRVAVRTGGIELILQQRWIISSARGASVRLVDSRLSTGPIGNEFDFNVISDDLTLSVLNSSSNVDDGVIIRAIVLGVK